MKKSKAKLAFEMLEKEMEVISNEQLFSFLGGYDSNGYNSNGSNPPGQDCFFHSFSGLLAQMGITASATSLEEQYNYQYGANSSTGGVSVSKEKDFMQAYLAGCNSSVQTADLKNMSSQLFQTLSNSGSHFIGNIDNGDGTFHAVTIKGVDAKGNYIYDDFQNGITNRSIRPSKLHSGIRVFPTQTSSNGG